jgi:hypothetical protein
MNKVKIGGPTVLFHGALAASLATFVGHYPWFATVSSFEIWIVLSRDLIHMRDSSDWTHRLSTHIYTQSLRVLFAPSIQPTAVHSSLYVGGSWEEATTKKPHLLAALAVPRTVFSAPWELLFNALQYNTLNDMLPKYDDLPKRLLRSAFMGWCSSFVSDICSNSIRVIKTSKQTSTVPITYAQIVKVFP